MDRLTPQQARLPGLAVNAANHTRHFSTGQRGDGFARVLGSVPDIGGQVCPRIFTDSFD